MHRLPQEILLEIFCFLRAKQLVCASRVCRLWNALANDDKLWRSLCRNAAGENLADALRLYAEAAEGHSPVHWRDVFIRYTAKSKRRKKLCALARLNLENNVDLQFAQVRV